MALLGALLVSLMLFGALSALGASFLSAPSDVVAWALAGMFLFGASAHFTKAREDLAAMVPPALPNPRLLVGLTGVFEVLGAVGLLIPATRGLAGICLVLLMAALLPADVSAARRGITLRGMAPPPPRLRVPIQLLFVGLTLWVALA